MIYDEILPITIHTDSEVGRILSTRRGVGRVRHLEARQLCAQKLTKDSRLSVRKVHGQGNAADMKTKPLDKVTLRSRLVRTGL